MKRTWRWRTVRDVLVVASLQLAAYVAVYAAGGSRTALPHAFYIPIVVAAVRFRWPGAMASAVVAGLLCGPLMPLDVDTGVPQSMGNWLVRAGFFLAVAAVAAVATANARRTIAREHALTQERTELATARTTLLQIVSHELRTPLTIIKGSMRLLDDHRGGDGPGAALVPAVERAVRRLEDLAQVVNAAVEQPDPSLPRTETPVGVLLEEAVASLAPEHDPGRVRLSIGTERALLTDPQSLRCAVRWLTENALKFSPRHEPVEITARDRGGDVVIEIRDRGPGIPGSFTTGSFEILRQGDPSTTREQGGLGLGLYATERVVRRLQGQLTVERAEAGGTIAAVTLPACPS